MCRLIDADVLLEHIKKLECHAENKKYEQGLNDFLQCYFPQIIDNQPTAFDKEKVVEQLEEKTDFLKDRTKYGNNDAEQQEKSYSTMMIYEVSDFVEDLIDIVKKGGVE